MIVRYYEFFKIEDFNNVGGTNDIRLAISIVLNKNIYSEIDNLRKRIELISTYLNKRQKLIFRNLTIYFWKKAHERIYRLHTNLVKPPQK